tara:strand:- start:7107 stop:7394 length:288 start_codon:yes stop_codon:yes gene_type:complete
MPLTPNKSYSTAVANEEAKILTKLFDNKRDEITFSMLSRIFKTNFALLLPFLIFKSILGLEVAVKAVSDPDKKPDKRIRANKEIRSKIVIMDIFK